MWLSKKVAASAEAESFAEIGRVSIGGNPAGVVTAGEKRRLSVAAPGGFVWSPGAERDVLMVTTADGEGVVVAELLPGETELESGELKLSVSEGTEIYLKSEGGIGVKGDVELVGDVELQGDVTLTGRLFIEGHLYLNGAEITPGL